MKTNWDRRRAGGAELSSTRWKARTQRGACSARAEEAQEAPGRRPAKAGPLLPAAELSAQW